MLRIYIVLALLFAGSASAAGWVHPNKNATPSTADPVATEVTPTNRLAYFLFTSADSTTTTGPVLKVGTCDRIEVAIFLGGATGAVKLYESESAAGSSAVAVTNLPQITSDFDNDGVSDSDALDQTTIEKSGLRDFMADGIVPIISTACSTGTCKVKVQCGGNNR